jgi:NAD(P)-dependent dehydrogenase (short-subunit alcohol dehydrogenase family)
VVDARSTKQQVMRHQALKRNLLPEDVARLVLFLAPNAATQRPWGPQLEIQRQLIWFTLEPCVKMRLLTTS